VALLDLGPDFDEPAPGASFFFSQFAGACSRLRWPQLNATEDPLAEGRLERADRMVTPTLPRLVLATLGNNGLTERLVAPCSGEA